ncbi:MAG TPA: YggS family pyridoxal phosphate-dependent enzyme [Clostridia bacterium]|nr:YggS family pyridoxal phosphate-dependent enzyme [Clostridia bacterium]
MTIAENCAIVQENISRAAKEAGRKGEDITLIAVTKYVSADKIAQIIPCGIKNVGENRVQELLEKHDFYKNSSFGIHFIGQLQTNKVKYVKGRVKLIHSLDRLPLAQALDRIEPGTKQDVLIEVNIGSEPQKGGVAPDELPAFAETLQPLSGIRVKGLMCVPPPCEEAEARRYFTMLRELGEKLKAYDFPNVFMEELSMGMSGDYMSAVKEGATMVRIGTALFGPRH